MLRAAIPLVLIAVIVNVDTMETDSTAQIPTNALCKLTAGAIQIQVA